MKLHPLPNRQIRCGSHLLDLSKPSIMGILNVTPDSFSDGGSYIKLDSILKRVDNILNEGGLIIDIGGESTRPNASTVETQEELDRVVKAVDAINQRFDCIISIDTSNPIVISEAYAYGAHIWNDVRALKRQNALETAVKLDIPIVLMHGRGEPKNMNNLAVYKQVITEVIDELADRLKIALNAGIKRDQIILDVGFGFAKNTAQNLELLNQLWQINQFNLPMLVGVSRKRFLGEVLHTLEKQSTTPFDRLFTGIATAQIAVQQGASIIRTHDVKATWEMLQILNKMDNK